MHESNRRAKRRPLLWGHALVCVSFFAGASLAAGVRLKRRRGPKPRPRT